MFQSYNGYILRNQAGQVLKKVLNYRVKTAISIYGETEIAVLSTKNMLSLVKY